MLSALTKALQIYCIVLYPIFCCLLLNISNAANYKEFRKFRIIIWPLIASPQSSVVGNHVNSGTDQRFGETIFVSVVNMRAVSSPEAIIKLRVHVVSQPRCFSTS